MFFKININGTVDTSFNADTHMYDYKWCEGHVILRNPNTNNILVGGNIQNLNGTEPTGNMLKLNSNGSIATCIPTATIQLYISFVKVGAFGRLDVIVNGATTIYSSNTDTTITIPANAVVSANVLANGAGAINSTRSLTINNGNTVLFDQSGQLNISSGNLTFTAGNAYNIYANVTEQYQDPGTGV